MRRWFDNGPVLIVMGCTVKSLPFSAELNAIFRQQEGQQHLSVNKKLLLPSIAGAIEKHQVSQCIAERRYSEEPKRVIDDKNQVNLHTNVSTFH